MSNKTVTRPDLIDALQKDVGLSRKDCAGLLEDTLNKIADSLAQDEPVKISAFASFSLRRKGERPGRNIKTGEKVDIPPRTVVVFKASKVLKNLMNQRQDQ